MSISVDRPRPVRALRRGSGRRPAPSARVLVLSILTLIAVVIVAGISYKALGARNVVLGGGGIALVVIGFWRVEALYLVAFLDAFFYESHWKPIIIPVIGVLFLRALLTGTMPRGWLPLAGYLGALMASLIFDPVYPGTATTLLSYLVGPALALVTAAVATTQFRRMVLLLLPLPFALAQVPVAVIQARGVVASVGLSAAAEHGDKVTGTLGGSKSGIVMLVAVAAAVVIMALAIEKIIKPWVAMVVCALLLVVGILSVAFAVLFVAPVSLAAVFLASGAMDAGGRVRRLLHGVVIAVVLVPVLVLAGNAVYPGWTKNISGLGKIQAYLSAQSFHGHGKGERFLVLEQANALVRSQGVATATFGLGMGATRPDAVTGIRGPGNNQLIVSQAQLASAVWVPQLLVECGYASIAAFFLLLLGVVRRAMRARRRVPPGSMDAAAALAAVGMMAFMVLVSFYVAGPTQPAIATTFWVLVGVVMAIPLKPGDTEGPPASGQGLRSAG